MSKKRDKVREGDYPEIPDQEYFTIGAASMLCLAQPHMLRYWEREFPQLQKVARRNSRRYYTRDDILLVRTVRDLLYNKGYTVSGARDFLKQQGKKVAVREQVDVRKLRKQLTSVIKLL